MFFSTILFALLFALGLLSSCGDDDAEPTGPLDKLLDAQPAPAAPVVEVDQDVDLEFRDAKWYLVDSETPFNGVAVSFYPETKVKKSRTRIIDGAPQGLIEEWKPDGSRKGGGFADDFENEE
jgi:hypothetical protein